MIQKLYTDNGYSLFELVVVIMVLAVLVTVAFRAMQPNIDIAKTEETKQELEQIAFAIAGNPNVVSGGNRIDYGYVGDNGSLPSSLNDLVTNPGLATWDGPYIEDDFYAASSSPETEFLNDGWGKAYAYSGSVTISSTGGGSSITKEIATADGDLLTNNISVNIVDLEFCPPGSVYRDSTSVVLVYPNGLGGYQTTAQTPSVNGYTLFSGIPIGQHTLYVIDLTNFDTVRTQVNVNPKSDVHRDIQIPKALWCGSAGGGSGTSFVEILRPDGTGSKTELQDENCSSNWQCVDEAVSDDFGTYVKGDDNQWQYDLYSTENSSINSGTIDSLVIFINVDGNGNDQKGKTYLLTNSNPYDGAMENLPNGFNTFSTTYVTNPATGVAWTWTEINNLEIGAGLRQEANLTQVWIEVHYTN